MKVTTNGEQSREGGNCYIYCGVGIGGLMQYLIGSNTFVDISGFRCGK